MKKGAGNRPLIFALTLRKIRFINRASRTGGFEMYKVSDYRTSVNYLKEQLAQCERFLAKPGHPLTPLLEQGTKKRIKALKALLKKKGAS